MSAVVRLPDAAPDDGPALAVLERLIVEAYEEHQQASRRTAETARRMGVMLLQAKLQVGHGHWMRWVEERLPFGIGKATYCMRIAEKYKSEGEIATIANLTTSEVLRRLAEHGESRERPRERDDRTMPLLTEAEAPTPTDAASRLRAAGMEVVDGGEPDKAQRFEFLIQRIARERPWDEFDVEALFDLDPKLKASIGKAAPLWIAWFGRLLEASKRARTAQTMLPDDVDEDVAA